ncbi:malonyl-[acyl-carrier protein] O-methyltransferase BioC [Rhodobacteraceae bacterium (ex Bugula neritina AB1)]|nr:malonyl-[acyl-carrier protein] O-methyltransferase BioC [Rhodobacteraceae bacterium (ex Bugula neritina AB1)]
MKDMAPFNFQADQNRICQSFRRGLASYHRSASVQAGIAAQLVRLLQQQGAPDRFQSVFEFGCGTGHLTHRLLESFNVSKLVLNDLVPEAAAALRPVLDRAPAKFRFKPGPVETLPLPQQLDLVVSASTVQWIQDLPGLMERLAAQLEPGGWLAVSGFGRSQFHELAALGSQAAAPSYLDAAEWPQLLPDGLTLMAITQEPVVLEFTSAVELLKHLRLTGVNGQSRQSWNRSRLQEFETQYRSRFGRNGMLPLTYDPVLLVARKEG